MHTNPNQIGQMLMWHPDEQEVRTNSVLLCEFNGKKVTQIQRSENVDMFAKNISNHLGHWNLLYFESTPLGPGHVITF